MLLPFSIHPSPRTEPLALISFCLFRCETEKKTAPSKAALCINVPVCGVKHKTSAQSVFLFKFDHVLLPFAFHFTFITTHAPFFISDSNTERNFIWRCLSWGPVSQRQLNNWRYFLCFLSLYQRWPSLVQKNATQQINLSEALWSDQRHFNWVENVNQFTEEDRSNWKEMSIKRLVRFIVSSLCHRPIQLMF